MSDDWRFTVGCVAAGAFALGLALVATGYYKHKNEQIAAMVAAGASPIEAACALEGDTSTQSNCTPLFNR